MIKIFDIIEKSFKIAWTYKKLWILAFLATPGTFVSFSSNETERIPLPQGSQELREFNKDEIKPEMVEVQVGGTEKNDVEDPAPSGSAFGDNGEGYFRISITLSDERLEEAMERIHKVI